MPTIVWIGLDLLLVFLIVRKLRERDAIDAQRRRDAPDDGRTPGKG